MQGINRLEGLQEHPNQKVYEKVVNLMEEHLGLDEVNDENAAENIQPGNFMLV